MYAKFAVVMTTTLAATVAAHPTNGWGNIPGYGAIGNTAESTITEDVSSTITSRDTGSLTSELGSVVSSVTGTLTSSGDSSLTSELGSVVSSVTGTLTGDSSLTSDLGSVVSTITSGIGSVASALSSATSGGTASSGNTTSTVSPTGGSSDSNGQCGSSQVLSCCNGNSASSSNSGGLLNLPFLALDCIPVNVAVVPFGTFCGNQQQACCETTQDGLINLNLGCIPLGV